MVTRLSIIKEGDDKQLYKFRNYMIPGADLGWGIWGKCPQF